MPLDDAVNMIVKNFEAYTKGERIAVVPPAGAVPVTAAGLPLGEKHPEAIQSLLNILVENRPLSSLQYDQVIVYLSEKKDQLVKNEGGGAHILSKPGKILIIFCYKYSKNLLNLVPELRLLLHLFS